jgi:hypothetical protein
MMGLLARALTRLAGVALAIAVALLGLGVALYCFDGAISLGDARPDRLAHLPAARRHVAHFLAQIAAPGTTAGLALVCGLGAMAIGVALIIGLIGPRRPGVAVLRDDGGDGRLAARPGPLRDMARALAGQAEAATGVRRPKLALARRGGGRLRVIAAHGADGDPAEIRREVRERLEPITEPFGLRTQVAVRAGDAGERVR